VKRREHTLHLTAALGGPAHRQPGRKTSRDRRFGGVDRRTVTEPDFDPVHAPEAIQRFLRRRDVHEDEPAVGHPCRPLVLQEPADRQSHGAIARIHVDR
jgi:hypothetical protein